MKTHIKNPGVCHAGCSAIRNFVVNMCKHKKINRMFIGKFVHTPHISLSFFAYHYHIFLKKSC